MLSSLDLGWEIGRGSAIGEGRTDNQDPNCNDVPGYLWHRSTFQSYATRSINQLYRRRTSGNARKFNEPVTSRLFASANPSTQNARRKSRSTTLRTGSFPSAGHDLALHLSDENTTVKKWRRLKRPALAASVLAICLFALASNYFLYFSHQGFPLLARLQLNHSNDSSFRGGPPEIVGHRGIPRRSTNPNASAQSRSIGNTREAIDAAIRVNVDWIEIDVRRTKDGRLVLFHDDRLEEKTNLQGKVESKRWEDLQKARLWVEDENDRNILLLETVLAEFTSPDLKWILDIKLDKESDIARQAEIIRDDVTELLKAVQIPNRQIIIFGDREIFEAFDGSGYRQGYTALFKTHRTLPLSLSEVLERCRKNQTCEMLVVPIVFVTPYLVESAKGTGIDVWSYGSDESRDLQYCRECGVKGLIVDKPGNLSSELRI